MLDHVKPLVKMTGAKLLLLHVADGWVARNFNQLKLAESEEMKTDRAYLDQVAGRLRAEGFVVETILALGDPPAEIIKIAEAEKCDLLRWPATATVFLATCSTAAPSPRSGITRPFPCSWCAARSGESFPQCGIRRTLDPVQQVALAVLEKQNPASARRRPDRLREIDAALFKFGLRRVQGRHAFDISCRKLFRLQAAAIDASAWTGKHWHQSAAAGTRRQ